MVDPARQTDVVRGYGYRQLVTRPFLGGGFVTAMSVPLIAGVGLPLFTLAAAVIAGGLLYWGFSMQSRSLGGRLGGSQVEPH
jgi:ESS family glutamate:Na+ symporter